MAVAPLVIPVFIPHQGCPHHCLFCNQNLITAQNPGEKRKTGMAQLPTAHDLETIISQYLEFKGDRPLVELAFFGGNFLGLPIDQITRLLSDVGPYMEKGLIQRLRCSTRPDTITREKLGLAKAHGMDLVELGVQSMDNEVLRLSGRGHTREDTLRAAGLMSDTDMKLGVQVMTGLPGDTLEANLETAGSLSELRPVLARIYPALVLADSGLAQWYKKGRYSPLSLETAVDRVKEMVRIFEPAGVPVVRMGLQASNSMTDKTQVLAGPWHPAFGHLVRSALMLDQVREKLDSLDEKIKDLQILVHPRSESRLRGDKNANVKHLARLYPDVKFSIGFDKNLGPGQIEIRL